MVECHRKPTYLEMLYNFTNETLEGELENEELCRFLVTPDFRKGNGFWAEAMGLPDATSSGLWRRDDERKNTRRRGANASKVLRVTEDLAETCIRGASLVARFIGSEWKGVEYITPVDLREVRLARATA